MNRRDLFKCLPALALANRMTGSPRGEGPRLRSALCAYSLRNELKAGTMTYDDLVRLAVDTDIDGLDLTVYWFPKTEDSFLLPLRRLAYRNGVAIYSISVRTDMCQPTPELRAKEIQETKRWVDVAAKLGAGHIRVFGGDVPKGHSEDEAAGWVAEILKRAGEYAGANGVILGLENHGGITLKAERVIQIVRQVDSPWVGINLDTGNFRQDSYRQIAMCAPYAVNAQFKTVIREKEKGEPADWDRLTKIFADAKYKGYLALEYEEAADAATAVPPLLRKLRDLTRKYSAVS
ncbi:MAG: sugar phosphate isomerase/epimerase [Bryobacteraceae bacterium]|nr:sugar phosphate isomerase/epimerase [Bryobacteraceae bacterium]